MNEIVSMLAGSMNLESWQVSNTIALLEEGSTIPFIARYRKERTGALTDEQIESLDRQYQQIQHLIQRRNSIISTLEESGQLTPELKKQLLGASTASRLEDLYLPYRPKRETRGTKAIAKGLEPLAKMLMSENLPDPESTAQRFVDSRKGVESTSDALAGARDIMAEWMAEKDWVRELVRQRFEREAVLSSTIIKGKADEDTKFNNWHDWKENALRAPSHRVLAILRGEAEGFLRVKVQPEKDPLIEILERKLVHTKGEAADQKIKAVSDSTGRILIPAMETEFRKRLKAKADEKAIRIFADNAQQLLLSPPLGPKRIMAIDPGFRTGCKVVCLDNTGALLHNDTIYPHPPQRDQAMAIKKIKSMTSAYQVEAIAIGNGTAGRETAQLIESIRFDRDLTATMVSEAGASVYSASSLAREELGDYDVTVRGAVSIGRRLMDPLAELVKIDPKAIGVGQYQHDVDQKLLKEMLERTVERCVNHVGVDINTASAALLTYVAGIGPKLAEAIVSHRDHHGPFKNRAELHSVSGMGPKTFEQCAGFLRIKGGTNPLDSSAVHPENYDFVNDLLAKKGVTLDEIMAKPAMIKDWQAQSLTTPSTGIHTVKDILRELEKPGRDPRGEIRMFSFDPGLRNLTDVVPGMIVPGIVTNITAFGAFVDIGVHESGLVHKKEMADHFVTDPAEEVTLHQQVMVRVLDVDPVRKRMSLSLKGINNVQKKQQ